MRRDTVIDFCRYRTGVSYVDVSLVRVDSRTTPPDFEVRTPTTCSRFGTLAAATYYMREIQRGYARPVR